MIYVKWCFWGFKNQFDKEKNLKGKVRLILHNLFLEIPFSVFYYGYHDAREFIYKKVLKRTMPYSYVSNGKRIKIKSRKIKE